MKIKILYEDKDILVIDKPSGISVHSDGKNKDSSTKLRGEKTIVDWVLKNYPKMKNVGEPMRIENPLVKSSKAHKVKSKFDFQLSTFNFITIARPGIVHRLDKDTSGVLILAKNQKAYEFLKKQFSASAIEASGGEFDENQNKIKKIYIAIVSGWVKDDRGIINKPIGRSPNDFRKKLAGRGARGELRGAITEYRVLKRFEESGNKFTYLEVRPKTGRTHQIRVHMKFINHPVVCDSLYNPNKPHPLGITRLALHAKSIEFSTPDGFVSDGKNLKGKIIKVESPVPKEFIGVLF